VLDGVSFCVSTESSVFLCCRRLNPNHADLDDEDEDVARERTRVMKGGAKDDVLRIEELSKVTSALTCLCY